MIRPNNSFVAAVTLNKPELMAIFTQTFVPVFDNLIDQNMGREIVNIIEGY